MGNSNSHAPEPQPMMEAPRYPLPDFNDIFHKGVPKMLQVADDMHRMTDYIMDLRNMTLGLALLSVVGMFLFLLLKWHNGRRSARNRRKFQKFQNGEYSSEHSSLSRPFRTYPQKPAAPDWSLHHHQQQHKVDMDKLMEHSAVSPSQLMSHSMEDRTPPPTSTASHVPNGGHMIKGLTTSVSTA